MNPKKDQMSSTKSHNKNRRNRGKGHLAKHHYDGEVTSMSFGKSSPIPQNTEKVDTTLGYVKWGDKNTYPYFLNYLSKKNPMHAGILRAKRYFTVAGGLVYEGPDQDAWEKFYANGVVNHTDKNLDQSVWDISLDYEKSNMFIWKVKLSALPGEEKKVRKIERIPFEKSRIQIFQDKEGNIKETGNIGVSNDWTQSQPSIQVLEPYNPTDDTQRMFYVLHQEESGQSLDEPDSKKINPGYYPDPPYGAAITSIDTGIQIENFNNAETYNAFTLGTVLNLNNGAPKNKEKKEEVKKEIQSDATGAYNAGGIMVLFANGKERAASVLQLNGNDLPDRYMNSKKGANESTIQGHSVTTPILFGVKTEGSLGNATELETGFAIMQSTYFDSRRENILMVLNWIGKNFAGLQGEIKFGEVELDLPEENEDAAVVVNIGDKKPKEKEEAKTEDEEETILARFGTVGRTQDADKVSWSKTLTDYDKTSKEDVIAAFRKDLFQDLTSNQMQTLNLIKDGNGFDTVRKALDISGADLAKIYKQLSDLEMISDTGQLLEAGAAEIAASDIDAIEVLFEYRLRADAPELLPGGENRNFCATLLGLNRVYTLEEIDIISGQEGYDVFRYRGGWYHNPDTDKNEPGCRHEWAQIIAFV